jgi:DNA-binding NtrC family response regulator
LRAAVLISAKKPKMLERGITQFIQKPYVPEQILQTVRVALDSAPVVAQHQAQKKVRTIGTHSPVRALPYLPEFLQPLGFTGGFLYF